ncbi:redoxin domain-containing protein [Natronosporangium hydrolyticum]|uniref:Redoxin domain-containing protein n=1 Tax=Natronosporangium hydrolyticum TaxID=2811111 RepID=A0A895YIG5_9ACTN|nr:redoxin domain-containing protein [Natronosporangium hydrolyticum]QSB14366.1 redoxin domain-containing protein [Natronosporangium hydrolyticum]
MHGRHRTLAFLTVAVVGLATAGCGDTDGADPAEPPTTAPAAVAETNPPAADDADELPVPETLAFTAATIDGGEFDGAQVAGSPVAFWFWAAWCSRCAAAAGDIREIQAAYAGQVEVVGVAGLGSGADGMRTFVAQHQLDDFPHLADDTGEVWQRFEVTTQEYFVILDAAGELVFEGTLTADALRDRLDGLVG